MKLLKAILFDLDNTLLDRDVTFHTFASRFVRHYFPALEAGPRQELIERIVILDEDGYRSKPEMFRQLREELQFEPVVTAEELYRFYETNYVASAAAMDGADALLQACRGAGMRVGLITNGRTGIQFGKLRQLGWDSSFDAVLVSEAAGCRKPERQIFEQALLKLNCAAEESLFVGDHPVNDVGGALGAGMHAVWLRRNQPWRQGTPEPLHTVGGVAELHRWLRSQGVLRE